MAAAGGHWSKRGWFIPERNPRMAIAAEISAAVRRRGFARATGNDAMLNRTEARIRRGYGRLEAVDRRLGYVIPPGGYREWGG